MSTVTSTGGPDKCKFDEICELEKLTGKFFPILKERFRTGRLPALKDAEGSPRLWAGKEVLDPLATAAVVSEVVEAFCACASGVVGKTVIIVIGMTGVGKSTLCNWLVGHQIETKEDDDEDGVTIVFVAKAGVPMFGVGHSTVHSQTFLPSVVPLPYGDVVLVDFPGFFDSSGSEIRVGIDLAFRSICQMAGFAHVIALLPANSVGVVGRSCAATWQLSKVKRLLPTQGPAASTWMVAITRCHKHFMKGPAKAYINIEEYVGKFFPALSGPLCNISDFMFGDASAMDFILGKVLGVEAGKTLKGDCLDADAVAEFGRVFKTNIMYSIIEDTLAIGNVKPRDRRNVECFADVDATCEIALADDKLQTCGDHLRKQLLWVCKLLETMEQARPQIVDGRLMVQDRFPGIESLCQCMQPRLKYCFVEADKQAFTFMMNSCIEEFCVLQKNVLHLVELQDALFSQDQKKALQDELERTRDSLENSVKSLGFEGMDDFAATTSGTSEFVALAEGAADAMVVSLPFRHGGLPAGTTLVAAVVGAIVSATMRISWKGKVRDIIETTIKILKAVVEASLACKQCILALNCQEGTLKSDFVLEVESRWG